MRVAVHGVTVRHPGSAILPTDKIASVVASFAASKQEEFSIEVDGDHIHVVGRSARFKFASEDPSLFPEIPEFDATAYHVVTAGDLRKLIRRTSMCCDVNSVRYALGGCLIELSDTSIVMVGTDGRRLAKMTVPADTVGNARPPGGSPVVPVKALKAIDKGLDDPDALMHVAFSGVTGAGVGGGANAVLVRNGDGGSVVYSRLVEGRFPKYADVFPNNHEIRVPMDVSLLRGAVDQASIVTSDESRGVDFNFAGETLTLSSQAADVGSSEVSMPISYEGGEVGITFDPRYLSDALKTIDDGEMVTAELIDHKNAAVFKTEDGYEYVVMPLTRDR